MMKIRITRATVCGGVDVFEDQVVDASEKDAKTLIGMKKAVPHIEEEKEAKKQTETETETIKKRNGR